MLYNIAHCRGHVSDVISRVIKRDAPDTSSRLASFSSER